MYLNKFNAKNIYGLFNFDLKLNKKLNIIIGSNGTGKTTVLKIILSIFNLDYVFLSKLKFDEIYIDFMHDRFPSLVDLKLHNFIDSKNIVRFDIFSETLNINYQVVVRDGKLFEVNYYSENTNKENDILALGKPMFLGLDRRFVFDNDINNSDSKAIVNSYLLDKFIKKNEDPLFDIIELIKSHALANRTKSFKANTQLRNNLIRNLLEKNEENFTPDVFIEIYKASEKYEKVKNSLNSLSLGKDIHEIITERLQEYADMSDVLKDIIILSKTSEIEAEEKFDKIKESVRKEFIDYKRLNKILDLLQKYKERNDEIFYKINLFQDLVNKFLIDTDKSLFIDFEGTLKVRSHQGRHDTSILSSGERQLIILIGNLIFNREMLKNRIFIIDEPELSLHISWQEMFIDTLLQGQNDIQLIFATHSPAIVSKYHESLMTVNDSETDFSKYC